MFKNLTVFSFTPPVGDALGSLLTSAAFGNDFDLENPDRPLGPMEMKHVGLGSVVDDQYARRIPGTRAFLLNAVFREKILPGAVVAEGVANELARIRHEENRSVSSRERRIIRDQIVETLLPAALTKVARIPVIVYCDACRILVDTATESRAESVLSTLRDNFGSLQAVPFRFDDAIEATPTNFMHDWMLDASRLPAGRLAFGDETVLVDPTSGAKWSGRGVELPTEEIRELLSDGFLPTRLGLSYRDRLGFVFSDDFVLRKVQLLDEALDDLEDSNGDPVAQLDADAALFLGEVVPLLDFIQAGFTHTGEELL